MKILLLFFVFCINCTKEEIEKLVEQIDNLDKKSIVLEQKNTFLEQQMRSFKNELAKEKTQVVIIDNNKNKLNTNNFCRKVKCVTVFLLQAMLLAILVWFSWQFILKPDTDPYKTTLS